MPSIHDSCPKCGFPSKTGHKGVYIHGKKCDHCGFVDAAAFAQRIFEASAHEPAPRALVDAESLVSAFGPIKDLVALAAEFRTSAKRGGFADVEAADFEAWAETIEKGAAAFADVLGALNADGEKPASATSRPGLDALMVGVAGWSALKENDLRPIADLLTSDAVVGAALGDQDKAFLRAFVAMRPEERAAHKPAVMRIMAKAAEAKGFTWAPTLEALADALQKAQERNATAGA